MIRASIALLLAVSGVASNATPDVIPDDTRDDIVTGGEEQEAPTGPGPSPNRPGGPPRVEIRYEPTCTPGQGTDTTCSDAYTCPGPNEIRFNVWRREDGGEWVLVGDQCLGGSPGVAPLPEVTPGHVLREVRRLPLPRATVAIQPSGRTLVNLDTVFSTTAPQFDETVTILGQQVHIVAKPTRYTWDFADGTTKTTASPGRPYPAMDVTHRYTKADRTHRPRVDVTFTISYSVDGGPTRSLEQTITTRGPAATLVTREATAVLVE